VDTGLVRFFAPRFTKDFGRLMENCVFLELKRRGNEEIFYYRSNEKEVDFLIREGLKVKQLVQVTYASSRSEVDRREIKALLKASKELKCKNLLVITWDYEGEERIDRREIKFIPLWKWLLKI
ncbi:MAG: AAA family ATPase, partial [Candidatus Aenigmatarchaeota archaeon]